jgi:hypothetical protein
MTVCGGGWSARDVALCGWSQARPLVQRLATASARLLVAVGLAQLLVACAPQPTKGPETRAVLEKLVPRSIPDRAGWIADLQASFEALPVEATPSNVCAVLAIAEQESGFKSDPVVADLPAITLREIDRRAKSAGIPRPLVRGVLALPSTSGESYRDRLERVKTERELSELYDDFIGRVPLGRRLFSGMNPVNTRGPMQVHVSFAERYAKTRNYPFPADEGIPAALFSRRGSLYFGIAHLLDYEAPYGRPLYRFADYNAGQYASRNAAFQQAVGVASGLPVTPDGALLPRRDDVPRAGNTENAVRSIAGELAISEGAIRRALEREDREDFGETKLYREVFELAERKRGKPLPKAALPRIRLEGPKISRPLTNEWFATRVEQRYQKCMRAAG